MAALLHLLSIIGPSGESSTRRQSMPNSNLASGCTNGRIIHSAVLAICETAINGSSTSSKANSPAHRYLYRMKP